MTVVALSSQFNPAAFHCARVAPRRCHSAFPRHFPSSGSACSVRGRRRRYDATSVVSNRVGNRRAGISSDENGGGSMVWLGRWSEQDRKIGTKPAPSLVNRRVELNGNGDASSGSGRGVDGGCGSTMERIVEKLKKFGYVENGERTNWKREDRVVQGGSAEDTFYREEEISLDEPGGFNVGSPSVFEGGGLLGSVGEAMFPWEKSGETKREGEWSVRSKSRTSMAELTLPESELRRLRSLTFQTKHKTRVLKGGLTLIHERWKTLEIIRLKIEGAPALNMQDT